MATNHLSRSRWAKSPLALAVSCVLATTSFSVLAQQDQSADNEQQSAEERPERIEVVGSRIRSDGMDEAAPIEVLNADEAIQQGFTNLGELLRSSTIAAGSNQITAATSSAVTSGGAGVETLSLRGLGANRTLVLLNGRRAGPAGTRGEVAAFDMNTLPLAAIERVEILKDGASSLYGSDAVAGVVNIITKKGDESSINFNTSQPMDSGGETVRANFTFGRSHDRGSFRVVGDYNLQKELSLGQRDFFDCAERYYFDPETGERADPVDPRTGEPHCSDLPWGQVWVYDYTGGGYNGYALAQYDYDGVLGDYVNRSDANIPTDWPEGWFPVGFDKASDGLVDADHPFQDLETLIPRQELMTVYGQGDYMLTDDVTAYAEVLFNRRDTEVDGYRQFWGYRFSEGFGDPTSEGWNGPQVLSPTPITDWSGSEITVDYRRFVLGLEGYLGDWFWDIHYQDSSSDGDYTTKIIYDDAISPYDFTAGSCEGTVTPVRGVACQDIPWFDPNFLAGDISPEMQAYLFGVETGNTTYDQRTLEAYITGDMFTLPAGVVGGAFGVSYQEDEIVDTPGDVTLAANTWGSTAAGITAGESKTKAVFGEIQAPLLMDAPLVHQLDLVASARYTDVDTYGSETTYKVGLNWRVTEDFRIRGSKGTSFRSPALYELYLNDQTSFIGQRSIDPCINWQQNLQEGNISQLLADNCAADGIPGDFPGGNITATVTSGGGAGVLEAETSDALTYGFVWMPEFTDFSLSVDYFEIEIEGEVTLLGAATIVSQCYNSEDFANEPLCAQVTRDPDDYSITDVEGGYLNIANQMNRGVDFKAVYTTNTPIGNLYLGYEHTVQIEASRQLFADSLRLDYTGEFGNPKHVGNLNARLSYEDWDFNWTARYIGEVSNYERYGQGEYDDTLSYRGEEVRLVMDSDAYITHAFSVARNFDNGIDLTFGVANAFDKEPPRVSAPGGSRISRRGTAAFYSQYDWLGRRVFLNLGYSF